MSLDQASIRLRYTNRLNEEACARSLLNCSSVLILHIGFAAATIALSILLWNSSLLFGLLFYPIALALVATRYRALSNILHECTHNIFASSYRANNFFSRVICIVLFYSLGGYREHHRTHHAFTGNYERDLEFGPIEDSIENDET